MDNQLTVQKEIERLVNQYPHITGKEVFESELIRLVLLAEREQLIKDMDRIKTLLPDNKKI